MDLYCPKCGEPWDNDEFHDVAAEIDSTYAKVAADFRSRGCEALGTRHGDYQVETDSTYGLTAAQAAGALYELLGDDMDGAAAMLEDMGF
jgi:hypothetical protein